MLAKRGLAWRNRWNTSGTPGTPTVLAKRGLACWNTSKSTSSINSRKYREIPGTWHVSPERGLTEQIQVFYRGRPAAALQRCTRSTGCSAAAAAAPAAALLLQLAARRCCCSSLQLAAAALSAGEVRRREQSKIGNPFARSLQKFAIAHFAPVRLSIVGSVAPGLLEMGYIQLQKRASPERSCTSSEAHVPYERPQWNPP